MNRFVLDCSLAMSWCFKDEKNSEGDRILESLEREEIEALVPSLWWLEVVNVLNVAERRARITVAQSLVLLDFLMDLPIIVDEMSLDCRDILLLAKTYNLSAYDAAYLGLAVRLQVPLATLDKKLQVAAKDARIPLVVQFT